jgi:hypothetical protein
LKAPNFALPLFKIYFWAQIEKIIHCRTRRTKLSKPKPDQHLTLPFLLKDTEKRYALPFEELV